MDDMIFVSECELARALADTVLLPDDTFDTQAAKLMAVIRRNKGEPTPFQTIQSTSEH